MKTGTVLGVLETVKAARGYENARWVQLRTDEGIEAALDPIGAAPGDLVLVAAGEAAKAHTMSCPADALVVAVVK